MTDKLREAALAELAQKPMHPEIKKMYEDYFDKCFRESSVQQRPWVGLTAEDMADAHNSTSGDLMMRMAGFARAIEAKLKEKNT